MTTYNPADKQDVTLSGGNLTATCVNNSGDTFVRGTTSKTFGDKVYWEITVNSTGSFTEVGLANSSYLVSGGRPGADVAGNSFGIDLDGGADGLYRIANAVLGNSISGGSSFGSGGIIACCYDYTNDLFWARTYQVGTGFLFNWNGTGGADPATGTGGFLLRGNGLAGGPYFHVFGNNANATSSVTLNPGTAAIPAMPPSGFAVWDAATGGPVTRGSTSRGDISATVVRGSASRVTKWIREGADLYSRRRSGLFVPRGFYPKTA
jgi:hypothetical protein